MSGVAYSLKRSNRAQSDNSYKVKDPSGFSCQMFATAKCGGCMWNHGYY